MIFPLWLAMLAQAVAGQGAPPAQPDAQGPKGSIRGTVVNEVTGAPVKKAEVALSKTDGPGPQSSAVTDASGGYSFSDLPAGRYRLRAEHADYRGSAAERAGHFGVDVILQPGDDKTGVAIALTPSAAVHGKVMDEDGDPVRGCTVELMRYEWRGNERTLTNQQTTSTNDKGEYRVLSVAAGRYYLRVSAQKRIRQPHALMPAKDVAKLPELGYATVFYPGAAEVSGATPLKLAGGAELRGINVRLPKQRAFRVQGKLEGPPEVFQPGGILQLFPADSSGGNPLQAGVGLDGGFVFDMVKPGAYVIDAQYLAGYWGRQEVTVGDAAVEGVTVRMQPRMEVKGRIEIEAAADGSVAKPQGQMKVHLNRRMAAGFYATQPQPATVAEDGTFAIPGLTPGTYYVYVEGGPRPSYIKSLRFGDRDIEGNKIPISAGEAGPLTILLGTKMGKVDGTVEGASGTTTVVFLSEPGGGITHQAAADAQGHFGWESAEPGEYRVFAVEGEDGILLLRGDVRKALEGRSEKVKVEEGATATVSLTVIPREMLERAERESE